MISVIVYVDLVPQLQCISLDDLKDWGRVDALQQNNIFFTVFDSLSSLAGAWRPVPPTFMAPQTSTERGHLNRICQRAQQKTMMKSLFVGFSVR